MTYVSSEPQNHLEILQQLLPQRLRRNESRPRRKTLQVKETCEHIKQCYLGAYCARETTCVTRETNQ